MDAVDLLRLLRRRWVAAVSLTVVLLAVLAGLFITVPVEYRTSGTVLAVRQGADAGPNPYAVTDPAQIQAATLLVTTMNAPGARADLKNRGATADYTITNESGPVQEKTAFVTVEVTGTGEAGVLETGRILIQRLRDELRAKQPAQLLPESPQVILVDVVAPTVATATRAGQFRAMGIAGAVGVVLIVLAVVIIDRVSSRRPRPAEATAPAADPERRNGSARTHPGGRWGEETTTHIEPVSPPEPRG